MHFDGRRRRRQLTCLLLAKSTTVAIDLCTLFVAAQSAVVLPERPYLAQSKAQIYCALSILSGWPEQNNNKLAREITIMISSSLLSSTKLNSTEPNQKLQAV